MNFKTESAFPSHTRENSFDGLGTMDIYNPGMSQYAYVAMKFHAARMTAGPNTSLSFMEESFNNADMFFVLLSQRTK